VTGQYKITALLVTEIFCSLTYGAIQNTTAQVTSHIILHGVLYLLTWKYLIPASQPNEVVPPCYLGTPVLVVGSVSPWGCHRCQSNRAPSYHSESQVLENIPTHFPLFIILYHSGSTQLEYIQLKINCFSLCVRVCTCARTDLTSL